jgi:CBS domain-containing protein
MNINTPISDIMTRHLVTISPNTSAKIAMAILQTHSMHHLPVVEKDKLVGIISEVDILKVTHCVGLLHSKIDIKFNDDILNSILAEEIMSKNTVTLAPSDPVSKAAVLFSSNKFHALPVVDGEKLVGILTTFDLIEYAYNERLKPVALS